MTSKHQPDLAKLLAVTSVSVLLAACSSSSQSFNQPNNPPANLPAAPGDPQNVQVVAGDDDSSEVQNTISWTLDPDATDYTVYWDNAAGVTENSSIVVPTVAGTRYVVHSGVDVLAGNSYYYRVQASSAGGSSNLSAEVSGTPQQAISSNQLSDVAWNGTDTLVAVGDSGVILASPNGTSDAWTDVSDANVPVPLAGVTWENVNSQFLIVGAASTVVTGDGINWDQEDLSNLPGANNLQDAAWLGDKYIVVGNNGTILTSNVDGSLWEAQDPGPNLGTTSFNAVAANDTRIVVVGTNGTVLTSIDNVMWEEQPLAENNDLNDITWDGSQFTVVGSNDTVLTSADGLAWTSHIPGTSDINFVAVTQFDSGLPQDPVLTTVGSSGTVVVDPDADPGVIVHTGTNRQLGGVTLVDDGVAPAYFVIVGHDGTVLTIQYE